MLHDLVAYKIVKANDNVGLGPCSVGLFFFGGLVSTTNTLFRIANFYIKSWIYSPLVNRLQMLYWFWHTGLDTSLQLLFRVGIKRFFTFCEVKNVKSSLPILHTILS